MRYVLTIAVLLLMGVTSSFAQSTAPNRAAAPDWLLIPAQNTANGRHLIITVPPQGKADLDGMMRSIEERYQVDVVAEWPLASIAVHCFVLRVHRGASIDNTVQQMEQDGTIRTVQTMKQYRTLGDTAYSDDLFGLQSNLKALNVVPAHQRVTGRNIKVAVVDTGIDLTHPDFANRSFVNKDFVGVGTKRLPREKHGTAVAGVIAASHDNGSGIVGVAPNAEIIGMRGCWQLRLRSRGRCSSFSLARAINFAILNDVDVINMSLGGPTDPLLAELIRKAIDEHNILVVAAYGENEDNQFPANQPGVIGVSGNKNLKAGVIAAPDIDILSTSPGGKYDFFSGSSVATAHVSAVAALMLEADKNLNPQKIFRLMQASSNNDAAKFFNTCEIISNFKRLRCGQ